MTNERAVFMVTTGSSAGGSIMVADRGIVGRAADADVQLDSQKVSRRHLRIALQGSTVRVQDLGSSNGTYVNDLRLSDICSLRAGDTVRMADVVLEYVGVATGQHDRGPVPPSGDSVVSADPTPTLAPTQSSSPSPSGSPRPPQSTLSPMLLSVLGAVAGTLASGALKEPSLRLVAAAVGAAIPPFVSVVGPFTRLRAATGVVVAALALLLTYTGTTLSDAVQGRGTTTFPVPRQVVEALGSGFTTQGDGTDTSDPLATCDVDPCFILSTDSVSCSITGCTPDVVVVRNSGRAPLTVAVEIVGADGGLFRSEDGCTGGTALAEGEECVLRITYVPGAALAHATLTIHQDPTGPAMSVELRGEPSTPNPSPTST